MDKSKIKLKETLEENGGGENSYSWTVISEQIITTTNPTRERD